MADSLRAWSGSGQYHLNQSRSVYTIRAMAGIQLEQVRKEYTGFTAVDDVSLEIADGEFLVLVGPSGCGKSTLLRAIAGLDRVTSGRISIGGREVTNLAPKDRDIAMVFQTYALYPHMTIRQNLGYGLKARKTPKEEIERKVEEVAELLELGGLLDRRPAQLSGGQRQRVAMGRAIAREPQAFLLDEPLSNLDAKLRVGMRASLAQLHRQLGITTVYVTHDQVEAMTLGQRVAVMRSGQILQVDTPKRLYLEPRDVFVAGFIGSPAMNLVEATVEDALVHFGQYSLPVPPELRPPAGSVILGIRPESFEDAATSPDLPTIEVQVEVLEDLGSDAHVFFAVAARSITAEVLEATGEGTPVGLGGALFTARVGLRTTVAVGERISLALDPRRLQFFHHETGLRLVPDRVELTASR
jgi:multiple sugar transport system ATP-binding protein